MNEYTRCDFSFPDRNMSFALAGIAYDFNEHFDHQYIARSSRQHLPLICRGRTRVDDRRGVSMAKCNSQLEIVLTVMCAATDLQL
jgi:hypothetical protein